MHAWDWGGGTEGGAGTESLEHDDDEAFPMRFSDV